MELFSHLAVGFGAAATLHNGLFALTGCVVGTAIGVLPGIAPTAAIAMLLPITFGLDPLSSLIMLAGIYYGAQYGGSTTAILVNMPGEASSIVTCLDGHQMARQGRAGVALAVAALGSFFAGCVGTVFIAAFGPILAGFAAEFTSPEYFALMVLGLIMAIVLAQGSIANALAMIFAGLLFGIIGTDINSGVQRYTFGAPILYDGIDFVPLVIGMFGVVEIIHNLESPEGQRQSIATRLRDVFPRLGDLRGAVMPALRGTGLGSILGVLPGGGVTIAAFASYALEKKVAREPMRFGYGAIEGVAGPEAANNAAAQTSFIPLLVLGFPSNAIMAVMMGAMLIQGIQPGPTVMERQPELFWGLIASMWIGNAMLLILNLPLIGIWVKLLSVPYRLLYPAILLFCVIGASSISAQPWPSMVMMAGFAAFGYVLLKFGLELVPFVLGFVLGPVMEENLRRSFLVSGGDPGIFFERPISAALIVVAAVLLALLVLPNLRRSRTEALRE